MDRMSPDEDEPKQDGEPENPAPEMREPDSLESSQSAEEEPVSGPASLIEEAAAPELHEEPLAEIERAPPQPTPPRRVAAEQEDYPFGEPEIPMPARRRRGDRQRRRDAKRNLDLDLGRIKRRKRYGLFITTLSVLFIAFVLAPVTWVAAYLFFDPPSNVLMMQRAAEGETIRHYPIPINRMSPHIVRAVIAAEDANFCTHDGFDIEAIQDAMEANRRGGRTRGASTISQQVAKNLFLWPDRSWVRKGFETYFTALIEFMWPKRRIMEAYLNIAEWGDGNFGIEAAARARFGVSAADLTPLQAARLAAVLPNPNRWRADNPGPYVRGRSATIVARAREVRSSGSASCVLIMDRSN
jgi:monofunctional biosynthetic peptidoglycan transglycosylase